MQNGGPDGFGARDLNDAPVGLSRAARSDCASFWTQFYFTGWCKQRAVATCALRKNRTLETKGAARHPLLALSTIVHE
jgi:hypothetical protein